jgi:hypothetical protein
MSNSIFDLEQQIQDCWKVTDDIDLITKHLVEDLDINGQTADAIVNKYSALSSIRCGRHLKRFVLSITGRGSDEY